MPLLKLTSLQLYIKSINIYSLKLDVIGCQNDKSQRNEKIELLPFEEDRFHAQFSFLLSEKFRHRNLRNNLHKSIDNLSNLRLVYENMQLSASWRRYGWPGKSFKAHDIRKSHVDCQIENKVSFLIKSPARPKLCQEQIANYMKDDAHVDFNNFPYTPTTAGLYCQPSEYMNCKGERNPSAFCTNVLSISLHDTWLMRQFASIDSDLLEESFLKTAALRQSFVQAMSEANISNNFDIRHYTGNLTDFHKGDLKRPCSPIVTQSLAVSQNKCVFAVFLLNTMRLDVEHGSQNSLNNVCLLYTMSNGSNLDSTEVLSKKSTFLIEGLQAIRSSLAKNPVETNENTKMDSIIKTMDFQDMIGALIDQKLYLDGKIFDESSLISHLTGENLERLGSMQDWCYLPNNGERNEYKEYYMNM
ncbi:MAG: hypothetical protein MHMPM18_001654 [Marteilia pararefringens]